MGNVSSILLLITFLLSTQANAEVSDKILVTQDLIVIALLLSVVAYILNRSFKRFWVITVFITMLISSSGLWTATDPQIGEMVIREQGFEYYIVSLISFIMVATANIVGYKSK